MDDLFQDIIFRLLCIIQDNPLPVWITIVLLVIFLIVAIFVLLLKNKSKQNTMLIIIDTANKFVQIVALIIGIIYGYSAINTYDIKKMAKVKADLEKEILYLNREIDTMSELMSISSEMITSKNYKIKELADKIEDYDLIIKEKENKLKGIDNEKRQLKSELKTQKLTLDKHYKIYFKKLFIIESLNTALNMHIRHINGLFSEHDIQQKMQQFMPSIYDIIIESLSTLIINSIPTKKFEELKSIVFEEAKNDISLQKYKFTYYEYSEGYINSFLSIYKYIKINKDGSIYFNFPENVMKMQHNENEQPVLFLDRIDKFINKAFKLN